MERRGARRRRSRRGGRSAGILVTALLLLTAVTCLLVVFLPRGKASTAVTAVSGKTYYFLCTAETEEKNAALVAAQSAAERGGAGYLYNDGKYKVVAAVYERESDAKTLVSVNADSFYFAYGLPKSDYASSDKKVLDYLIGDWFNTVYTAATELERGNTTESAAEHAVMAACDKLTGYALNAASERLKRAVIACAYDPPQSRTVLSYIRYINVSTVLSTITALI